jgi:serine/threonine protein kinase
MGELHLAYAGRADLKKLCVIKTILGHLADDEFINRFVDEAKVVVRLSHGNIVPVFEAGQVEGQYFLVMEYIEGRDLRNVWNRLVETNRRCPLEIALYIVREICRGLAYVHTFEELHLVHRDVSPPNVLLSYTGEVRLTDFGVATSTIKLQKTAPGILLGKLSYMSPEQAKNDPVDARADVYSAGVILWELLTGQRLFPADRSQLERYEQAVNPSVRPPSLVDKALPPNLDLIALRALARAREARYADAELMRRELASALARVSPTTDAISVQALLKELYGSEIDREREERRQLLESMAEKIKRMTEDSGQQPSLARADTQPVAGAPVEEEGPVLPRLPDGTVLADRYRILSLIGEGGMGTVYTATHVEIDKLVAVKVLHPVYSRMPDVVSRFRQEARAASRIGHPNIVEVFDSGTTSDGAVYFVMENLEGMDLGKLLDEEKRLAVDRAIQIARQICEAVGAAHDAGIIHRDLKPENIFLISREGQPDFVKVLDFGIAKNIELEETSRQRLTHPGMAMGTPEYMAPEQAAGLPTDHRVDIYAAGAILYEMVVGNAPHTGSNLMAVLSRKATEPVVPPREVRPDLPESLERLILWALRFDPEERPQSMAQMVYELTKLTRGRAGAVASLLGLPGISGPPTGPSLSPAVGYTTGPHQAYDPVIETASLPRARAVPEQRVPWRDGAPPRRSPWLPLAIAVVGLGGIGGVVLYQRLPARTAVRAAALDASGAPLAVRRPDADAPTTRPTSLAARAPDAGLDPDGGALAAETAADGPGLKIRRPLMVRASPQAQLAAGRKHLLAGAFNPARSAFESATRSARHRGAALTGLAEVEFQLGQHAAAERYAKEAVAHGGGLRARLVLGNIYFKLRDYRKAVQKYREVLALDANHKEAKRNLAAAQQRLSQ